MYVFLSFLVYNSFRHPSFHLSFIIVKLQQVLGFMLLLKKDKEFKQDDGGMKPHVLSTLNKNCGDSIKATALSHSSSRCTA